MNTVERAERSASSFDEALTRIVLNTSVRSFERGTIARILAGTERGRVLALLMEQFFSQESSEELWETGLALTHLDGREIVEPLVRALRHDPNPDRRHVAARVLGWISNPGPRAAEALIDALLDRSQPHFVREDAAESLAYCSYAWVVPPLLSVVDDPDARVRFWVAFALGTRRPNHRTFHPDPRAIEALERMLSDEAVPPGNWWSVGREALAMLGNLDAGYRAKVVAELKRIVADPEAPPEGRRWVECYDDLGISKAAVRV